MDVDLKMKERIDLNINTKAIKPIEKCIENICLWG